MATKQCIIRSTKIYHYIYFGTVEMRIPRYILHDIDVIQPMQKAIHQLQLAIVLKRLLKEKKEKTA